MLRVKNVAYWYKDPADALFEDISMDFEAGKLYTIIGKSGSGKTTFLSLISGLEVAKKGEISYEDKILSAKNLTTFRQKDLSIVFQAYNLLPYMSAYRNVRTALEISGNKIPNIKSYVREKLTEVGIDESLQDKKVSQLSGGQQQRVAIVRAMATGHKLVVADEPTGNLDEETSAAIVSLFKKMAHEQDKTVILVTHNHDVAAEADVVLELKHKKLTERK